ncbi:hypothetical protein D3C76_1183610 [compost metagenome]
MIAQFLDAEHQQARRGLFDRPFQLHNLVCIERRKRRVRIEVTVQYMVVGEHLVMRVQADGLFGRFAYHKS